MINNRLINRITQLSDVKIHVQCNFCNAVFLADYLMTINKHCGCEQCRHSFDLVSGNEFYLNNIGVGQYQSNHNQLGSRL